MTTSEYVLALLGVLAPILVALGTWYSVRNGKEQTKQEKLKADSTLRIETLEKASGLAMTMAEKAQDNYDDCEEELEKVKRENDSLVLTRTTLIVNRRIRMAKLRDLITKHNSIAAKYNQEDCPGLQIINEHIGNIISEMEKEEV